ncbi:MAG: hypothetical protein JO185_10845, partial [Acidobacteriaceae bacterium]|nr:hypothetical protein [Acidobacteriaceae bacterium]
TNIESTSNYSYREAGSQLTPSGDTSGFLQGVLARRRQGNWYQPIASAGSVSTSTGTTPLDMYTILAQPPTAFPVPSDDPQVQYIENNICVGCDLRQQYSDTNIASFSDRIDALSALKAQDGKTCPDLSQTQPAGFCTARAQLLQEMTDVDLIRGFQQNLDGLFAADTGITALVLNNVYPKVNEALNNSVPNTTATSIVENVVNTVLSIGSAVGGPAAPAFGVASALFSFSTSLAQTTDGNSAVLDINVQASDIANQAVQSFTQQGYLRGVMFDVIYEDWGKLQALAGKVNNAPPGSPFYWNGSTTTSALLDGLSRATEISFYQSLLAPGFVVRVWNAQDPMDQTPGDYKYDDFGPTSIFRFWRDQNWIGAPSARVSSGAFELDMLMFTKRGDIDGDGGSNDFDPSYIQLVPDSILQHVFAAPPDGLGVSKSQFYRQWPFDKFYCSAPGNGYSGSHGPTQTSNCDWTTPPLPQ